jgi:hypothetical protein
MPHDVASLIGGFAGHVQSHAPAHPYPSSLNAGSEHLTKDIYFGGTGKIVATVKKDALPSDIPVSRRVRLIHEQSGRCLRETWSRASDGEYRFENIALGVRYTVIAYDHTEVDRGEIADRLYAEPM